jgi:hypothetical protein
MASDQAVKPQEQVDTRLVKRVREAQAELAGAPEEKRSAAMRRFADALHALAKLVFDGEIPKE